MTDLNLSAVLGPRYEIILNGNEPLKIEVGAGHSGPHVATSDTLNVAITAQEAVGAYRAIGYDGAYTQPNINSLATYAGVTQIAAIVGDSISAVRIGLITESAWTWTPDASVFIGIDGVLTQTQPLAGNPVRRIGWAISATKLNLDPYPTIGA